MTTSIAGLDIAHRIDQRFPGAVSEAVPEFAVIENARIVDVLMFLRDDEEMQFKFLSSLTAVDRMEWFEVVYHLESFRFNLITSLKVKTPDREDPVVRSVTSVFEGAHLQEREAYDLMGIRFEGHPDLRRIFMWEGFAGWPLRKDFLNMPGGQMPGLERFPGDPGPEFSGRGTK